MCSVGWLLSSREERAVEKTRWVSASVAALWNMICVSDLLSAELSPKKLPDVLIAVLGLSGMLMAFGNAFFLCIFLDKRTRLRGGVALGSWLMLMVILALIPAGK